jgi:hypothetical protein
MAATCRGYPPPSNLQKVGLMLFIWYQGKIAVYDRRNQVIAREK